MRILKGCSVAEGRMDCWGENRNKDHLKDTVDEKRCGLAKDGG